MMPEYYRETPRSTNERLRRIRFRMQREKLRFADEIRLVPSWLAFLVCFLFVVVEVVMVGANRMGWLNNGDLWPSGADPIAAMLAVGGIAAGAGIVLGSIILLIGYVHQDAKRRGMNAGLWTLLVIMLLPGWIFIGFTIYFLVREPLPYHCTQCGAMVSARFNFCPNCRINLRPACPQCRREVSDRDRFCPYCGYDVVAVSSAG